MDTVSLIARVILVLMFLASGFTKMKDQRGTRQALRNFGVPAIGRRHLAVGLPLGEFVFAVLMIAGPTAWWGALGAFVLLFIFTCAIAYQLTKGRTFECHCFGDIGAGPIGPGSVVRNIVLLVLTLVVLVHGWSQAQQAVARGVNTFASFSGLVVALLVVILGVMMITFWVTAYAYKRLSLQVAGIVSHHLIRESPEPAMQSLVSLPPPIGDPAPVLELPDLGGKMVDASTFLGKKILLVFIKPGCWACDALVPELIMWEREDSEAEFRLVVVSRGSAEANQDLMRMRSAVLLSPNAHVANSFGVGGTPGAVFLDAEGSVASEAVLGTAAVTSLLRPTEVQSPPATILEGMRRIARQSTHRLARGLGGGTA